MRAVVCGAGITGLALARQLATAGWEVVVVERAPGPRTAGYMIDFFGPGFDTAEAMGLLPRIRELAHRVGELAYVDERGRTRARLDYARFTRLLGGRVVSILRSDLERALRERLPGGVTLRFGCTVTGVEQDAGRVRARLSDGSVLAADVLVGADGVRSRVRHAVTGPGDGSVRPLGFHTAAWLIDDPDLRHDVGDGVTLTDTLHRQVGLYGLRDGRVAVFTVHRTRETALPADPRAAVRDAYATLGWVVPRVLAQCPERPYYDLVAQVAPPRWSAGRVVLAGDACHAVSLLGGQGASLGIAGAHLLAELLTGPGPVPAALARYERIWRPVVTERQRTARSGAEWFLPSSRLRLRARRLALAAARLPGAERFVASGLVGDPAALTVRRAALEISP